jgi:hypothetical protein
MSDSEPSCSHQQTKDAAFEADWSQQYQALLDRQLASMLIRADLTPSGCNGVTSTLVQNEITSPISAAGIAKLKGPTASPDPVLRELKLRLISRFF